MLFSEACHGKCEGIFTLPSQNCAQWYACCKKCVILVEPTSRMGAYWVQQLSRQHPGAGGAHLGLFRVLLRRSGGMWLPGTRGAALYHKCARNGWPAWPFDASPCPHESARWPGGTAREIRVCPTSELGSTLVPDGDLGCSEHGMSMIWDLDTTPRLQTIATKSRVLQYLGLTTIVCRSKPHSPPKRTLSSKGAKLVENFKQIREPSGSQPNHSAGQPLRPPWRPRCGAAFGHVGHRRRERCPGHAKRGRGGAASLARGQQSPRALLGRPHECCCVHRHTFRVPRRVFDGQRCVLGAIRVRFVCHWRRQLVAEAQMRRNEMRHLLSMAS